jgi:alkaline phosphatase D
MTTSTATWQVLGQQVVMGRMNIPAELLSMLAQLEGDLDDAQKQAVLQQMQQSFTELAALKTRMLQGDPTLTDEEKARVTTVIPYNLDAWDGYFMERETVLGTALQSDKNLVVLSGDSHNSWANDLKASNPATMKPELQAGVEFAVTSVTSPGLEEYLALSTEEMAQQFEQVLQLLIDDLQYCNLNNRGFMIVTFTPQKAEAEWLYVDNIDSDSYALLATRSKKLAVLTGSENRKLVQVS